MKKTLLTIIGTVVTIVVFTVMYLLSGGNLEIQERTVEHTKQVYEDGELTVDKKWTTKTGYTVKVNIFDEAVFGK